MMSEIFFKLYAKIPDAERKFTIVIIDGQKITWEMAYKEIQNKTELGQLLVEVELTYLKALKDI